MRYRLYQLQQEPCIGFTQKNLIEFQVQNIYLIYARLAVYTILYLIYSKGHILFIRSIYVKHIV